MKRESPAPGSDLDARIARRLRQERDAHGLTLDAQSTLADANSPGWLTRFFTSPWMPF